MTVIRYIVSIRLVYTHLYLLTLESKCAMSIQDSYKAERLVCVATDGQTNSWGPLLILIQNICSVWGRRFLKVRCQLLAKIN